METASDRKWNESYILRHEYLVDGAHTIFHPPQTIAQLRAQGFSNIQLVNL